MSASPEHEASQDRAEGADTGIQLPPGLTLPQEQALLALLAEPTVAKAAASVGVHERTLYRWLADPVFSAAFRRTRREAFAHAVTSAQRYTPVAVIALARIVSDGMAPASARVSAACALLKFARESIELDDLAGRVEFLERHLSEPQSKA